MNRPASDAIVYISESVKGKDGKFWQYHESCQKIDIFDSSEIMRSSVL